MTPPGGHVMGLVAVLAAALAAWVWAGPDSGTTRLASLTGTRRARDLRRFLAALTRRPRPGATAAAWRAASIELCQILAAELSAGRPPGDALVRAVSSVSLPDPAALAPVVAAARDGGDVAAALSNAAPARGGEGLVRLAACWRVSVAVGGGLTTLVERVCVSLREAQAHREEVAAQLSGPRATARMLAGLPVLGLLMAAGLGMNPLAFLLGGPAGFACLVVGLALDAAGVCWTHRLVARAEELPGSATR
ncbi:type II secretion system F family protein [Microbispora sp. H13382]|uniref:type II secretion system F family protein n=1 Tax=Microbispora sp. H13382 TaxID=2729112 RepID=UPI002175E525|nr:type II secretion system F family protein [Microbispora sp. H13382]